MFYGVHTGSGYLGSGVDYIEVPYDDASRTYTLTRGANITERYRIGRDGAVVAL